MKRRGRQGIYGHIALGSLALPLATSCVPQDPLRIARAIPAPSSRSLLRQLALTVPDDIANTPLIPRGADGGITDLHAAPPFVGAARTVEDATRASECLTAAVYYEARSQSDDGQRAVAQVVLNRVRDRAFPNTVCGVVYQGSTRSTGCQFSFTCDGSMYRRRDENAWARAHDIAAAALAGDVYAPVGSATYYHANSIMPWWASSLSRVASVGAHIFYRWRGSMERALAFRQDYAGIEPAAHAGLVVARSEGVAVHYGNRMDPDVESSPEVSIHRGPTPSGGALARATFMSGVRIHVGTGHGPASAESGDAVVSEETGPI